MTITLDGLLLYCGALVILFLTPGPVWVAIIARGLTGGFSGAWPLAVRRRASTSPRQPKPLVRAEARRWIETWMAFPMTAVDGPLVLEAVQIAERFQIGHFDAQILAAAKRIGCATVYSEDLNSGQDYGGVRVVNPFLPKG